MRYDEQNWRIILICFSGNSKKTKSHRVEVVQSYEMITREGHQSKVNP